MRRRFIDNGHEKDICKKETFEISWTYNEEKCMEKLILTGQIKIKIDRGKLKIKCQTGLCKWMRKMRYEGVVKRQILLRSLKKNIL